MQALVVDDSNSMRQNIGGLLRLQGWEVYEAENGEQAMYRILTISGSLRKDIDLITLDWKMPVMDGMEFLTWLRATPAFARVKVLLISGHVSMPMIDTAMAKGVNAYLTKPFTLDLFRQQIEMLGFAHAEKMP